MIDEAPVQVCGAAAQCNPYRATTVSRQLCIKF